MKTNSHLACNRDSQFFDLFISKKRFLTFLLCFVLGLQSCFKLCCIVIVVV